MTEKFTKLKLLSTQSETALWRSITKTGGSASPDEITAEGAEIYDAYTGKTLKAPTLGELARQLKTNEQNYDEISKKIAEIRQKTDRENYNEQLAAGIKNPTIEPMTVIGAMEKLSPQDLRLYNDSQIMLWGIKRLLKNMIVIGPNSSVNTKGVPEKIQEKLREVGFDEKRHKDIIYKDGNPRVLIGSPGAQGDTDAELINEKVSFDNIVIFYSEDMTDEEIARSREIQFKHFTNKNMVTEKAGLLIGKSSALRTGIHPGQIDIGTGLINLRHEHVFLDTRVFLDKNYLDLRKTSSEDLKNGNVRISGVYPNIRRVSASISLKENKYQAQLISLINEDLKAANLPEIQFVRLDQKLDRFCNIIGENKEPEKPKTNTKEAESLTNNIQAPLKDAELSEDERKALDKVAKEKIDENTVKEIKDVSVEEADPVLVKAHAILREKSERLAKELLDTKETADAIQTGIIASVNLKKANAQIESLVNEVAVKEKTLTEANAAIELKEEIIEEKQQEVNAFAAKNNELFDKLTVSDTELAQRDFETKQVSKVFKNPKLIEELKDNNLITNDDMYSILTGIEGKQIGNRRLKAKILKERVKAEEKISSLESDVRNLSRTIKVKELKISKKDAIIDSLNSTISDLKQNITNLVDSHAQKVASIKESMKKGYRGLIERIKDNFNKNVIPAAELQAKIDAVKDYEANTLPGKIKQATPGIQEAAILSYEKDTLPEKVAEAIIEYTSTEEFKEEFDKQVKKSVSAKTAELSKRIVELENTQNVNVETLALYVIQLRDQIESLKQSPIQNDEVDNIMKDLYDSLSDDNDNKPKL